MDISESFRTTLMETAEALGGVERRLFMARTVRSLGPGGQRQAEIDLGWNRGTIRKGLQELQSGIRCCAAYSCRGRRRAEERLPELLDDIRDVVTAQSQTDPRFRNQRLYTRLTAEEVRKQLQVQKGYSEAELPHPRTIRRKLNDLGFHLTKVAKCKPKKKIKETDAIFERLNQMNPAADQADDVLRLSLDAKATVKIGCFSRGGKSRTKRQAADHDFKPLLNLTPYGIFLPRYDDLYLYFTASAVTADFIVDMLDRWWRKMRRRFSAVKALVINQDNGPENQSRRTQFLKRMVEFAQEHALLIRLAYYPPYHSKYNAIEHCWGTLETHWNGEILDAVDTVLNFARSMTWNDKQPVVELISKLYHKGVRLSAKAMKEIEAQVERLPKLGKWFVDIHGGQLHLG